MNPHSPLIYSLTHARFARRYQVSLNSPSDYMILLHGVARDELNHRTGIRVRMVDHPMPHHFFPEELPHYFEDIMGLQIVEQGKSRLFNDRKTEEQMPLAEYAVIVDGDEANKRQRLAEMKEGVTRENAERKRGRARGEGGEKKMEEKKKEGSKKKQGGEKKQGSKKKQDMGFMESLYSRVAKAAKAAKGMGVEF